MATRVAVQAGKALLRRVRVQARQVAKVRGLTRVRETTHQTYETEDKREEYIVETMSQVIS